MSSSSATVADAAAAGGRGHARAVRSAAASLRANLPFVLLGLIALIAIAWPLFVPYDPLDTHAGEPLLAPSGAHLFGTDQAGRDVFSRVVAGTRISVTVSVASAGLAAIFGGVLGVVAAMAPKWIGETIMRFFDIMLAFPAILLAIVVATTLGSGVLTTVIVLAVVFAPRFARFVRALALDELQEDYVTAARLLGMGKLRLVGYHIGINVIVPVLVYGATISALAIVLEAALSYIGLGVPAPDPSWGNIISDGKGLLYSGQWWVSTFPGIAILLTVMVLHSAANAWNKRLDAGVDRT